MQKIETLKNKSGESIYPLTSTKAVVDENGNTIEDRLVVADGEDLVTDGNVLRLKDRPNTDGMGYVILRKDKTFQEQVTKPNTIYEIRYDFDLNGAEITIPEGSTLTYKGGHLLNGSVKGLIEINKNAAIDWNVLSKTCGVSYSLIWDNETNYNDAIYFDLQNLQGPFKKYTLKCDGSTDNSTYLKGLLSDSLFKNIARYRKVVLGFTRSMRYGYDYVTKSCYLFKAPINFEGDDFFGHEVELQIDCDIRADYTDIEGVPTKEELINGSITSVPSFHLFRFAHLPKVTILGGFGIFGQERRYPRISCGAQSFLIKNNYYEGITSNSGWNIYSSIEDGISIFACGRAEVRNIEINDSFHGLVVSANSALIDSVVVDGSIGDNGITLVGGIYRKQGQECGGIVSNCVCRNCKDLGISIQAINTACINCLCENCGNDNDNTAEDFGVNGSFNSGGGFDAEPYLRYKDKEDKGIVFINCTARNCYNYAFHTDTENVKLIGCTIDGITSTWRSHFPIGSTEFKYQAVRIRKGGALSTSVDATKVGFIVSDCTFKNCTNIVRDDAVRTNLIYNSTFENITANEWNSGKAELIGCKFDDNFDFTAFPNISYHHTVGRSQGTTQQRPNVPVGEKYFDTTLGKPLVWNGTEWIEADGSSAGIQRAGMWKNRPNADGSFLDNGFQYFLLESEPDEDPDGNPIESITGNGKPIWWIQDGSKWVDATGATVTG